MIHSTAVCPDCPGPGNGCQGVSHAGVLGTLARSLWSALARTGPAAAEDTAPQTTLKSLRIGQRGRVQGFEEGGRAYRRKLLSMGLTPGVQFQVLRVAPMGDPVEVRVRGSNLSLRRDEAAALRVERLS